MKKKTSPRSPRQQLGVDVPPRLAEDLHRVVERLGLVKKRAIAAAVSAFVHAGSAQQLSMYQDVYRRYYVPAGQSTPEDLARDVAATLRGAQRAHKAKAAGKTAGEKTA